MREAVIVSGARPAVGRAPKGTLRAARLSSLLAGMPDTVPAQTVNRFCSSGLQTISMASERIMVGNARTIVAGGTEHMSSTIEMPNFSPNPRLMEINPAAYMGMGLTAEQVAREFDVGRQDQDEFALRSHTLAKDAVEGVRPEVMGIGPTVAIPKVLEQTGLTMDDIDLIEFNEAFAAQALAVIREVGMDLEKTNVNGGAITLGHPMGATGTKLTVQLIHEMKRRGSKYGLVTMCIGGGMGAAGIFENLQN